LTAEQLEASRAERMRLNGNGVLTLEDARTWIEETGLCLFLPRRQFSAGVAPSFVEAIAGQRNPTPDGKQIALAEELLVRLETEGVAVRLNLLGQPGEQPDFVVAAWVLPYVYALRGDRDWRRTPQLTGSRQVSPLAIQTYKLLEQGDATIPQLKHTLGREVTEAAVLRAITELWQQLRIIPVIAAPGRPAQWQLLRQRFQKAIAEGASTSQVTAISVLASIYLQAVIAASMEEVELFLASLTARSKVREVLRGLVATRQVHTIALGHAPHFYVAGTLPEFSAPPTVYASSAMAASSYFAHGRDFEEEIAAPAAVPSQPAAAAHFSADSHAPRVPAPRKPASAGKPASARPHFSRPVAHARDRKPAQSSASNRSARRPNRDARGASGLRHASNGARWASNGNGNGKHNGTHSGAVPGNANGHGSSRNGANGIPAARNGKSTVAARAQRNGKPPAKAGVTARSGSLRKDARIDARSSRNGRKPALTAGAKAGNSKRYGFTAPAKRGTKKRG
jgi:23S rRNA pseudouridine2605 synthase